jgi:hypothetical protein
MIMSTVVYKKLVLYEGLKNENAKSSRVFVHFGQLCSTRRSFIIKDIHVQCSDKEQYWKIKGLCPADIPRSLTGL